MKTTLAAADTHLWDLLLVSFIALRAIHCDFD
jgi:hypothetical protein